MVATEGEARHAAQGQGGDRDRRPRTASGWRSPGATSPRGRRSPSPTSTQTAGKAAARSLGSAARFLAHRCRRRGERAQRRLPKPAARSATSTSLVNNAGIIHAADFLDIAEADFDRVLRVNLKGAFLVGQAAARQMVAQVKAGKPPGAIVNMSSVNAVVAIAEPGALLRVEGRHRPAHQGDGAVARALRHPRQRHRPGLDHDRHAQGAWRATRRPSTASCRARRSAASASPTRSPRSPPSSPRDDGKLHDRRDHLRRRRPARAQLHGAGRGAGARVILSACTHGHDVHA